jgi:hypothetical protein
MITPNPEISAYRHRDSGVSPPAIPDYALAGDLP